MSVTVNGISYTYLPGTNEIDPSSGSNIPGSALTVTTALGGIFTFYFVASGSNAAGSWSYLSDDPGTENISYVLRDGDGDLAGNTLAITVVPANDAPEISLNVAASNGQYRDEFGSVAYSNTNGTTNWSSTPWTETSDNNSAASGAIRIESGQMRFGENGVNGGATIERPLNLAGATSATLSFNFSSVGTESDEELTVTFAADGVNFVSVAALDSGDLSGLKTFNLTGPFTSNAVLRFTIDPMSANDEYLAIDNVNVAFAGVTSPTYTEGGAAVDILPTATLADPDNPTEFSGGSLHVQLTAGVIAGDQLLFTAGATESSGSVFVGATNVGTVTGYGTANMLITFNTNASDALVEQLMQAVGFSTTSDNPGTSRTATVTFNDGGHTGAGGSLRTWRRSRSTSCR